MLKTKYIAIAAITMDGKIAKGPKHFSDWTSPEDKKFMRALLDKCDCVIVGNNTYKAAKGPLSKRSCIVFSRSADKPISRSANLLYINPAKTDVKKLMNKLGCRNIAILGGAQTYAYCLENRMLDELYLTIEPIIFGKGINLFETSSTKDWGFELLSIKKLNKHGTILLHYGQKS